MPGFFASAFATLLASALGEEISYSRNGGAATTLRALIGSPDVEGAAAQAAWSQDVVRVELSQSVGFEPAANADTFTRSGVTGTYRVSSPATQDEVSDAWVFMAYRE